MHSFVCRFTISCAACMAVMPAYADRLVLVAGGGSGTENVAATEAKLIAPFGIDFDKAGNAYMIELTGQRLLKIDGKGMLTIVGGTGEKGDSGDDGPARKATFSGPHSLAVGPDGSVYIA